MWIMLKVPPLVLTCLLHTKVILSIPRVKGKGISLDAKDFHSYGRLVHSSQSEMVFISQSQGEVAQVERSAQIAI